MCISVFILEMSLSILIVFLMSSSTAVKNVVCIQPTASEKDHLGHSLNSIKIGCDITVMIHKPSAFLQ